MFNRSSTLGFAFIEILLLSSMLSFVSSIIFASITISKKRSEASAVTKDMIRLRTATQIYVNNTGTYPSEDLHELVPSYIPEIPTSARFQGQGEDPQIGCGSQAPFTYALYITYPNYELSLPIIYANGVPATDTYCVEF
jgi:type II secretory pathway pseudopilin PulG